MSATSDASGRYEHSCSNLEHNDARKNGIIPSVFRYLLFPNLFPVFSDTYYSQNYSRMIHPGLDYSESRPVILAGGYGKAVEYGYVEFNNSAKVSQFAFGTAWV